jgi:hypothetical protein
MNNFLNARYDPRPEALDKVASVFGITGWMLLSPYIKPQIGEAAKVQQLLDAYGKANDEGKADVARVAELAAKYNSG